MITKVVPNNNTSHTIYWIRRLKTYILTIILVSCPLYAQAAKPTDFIPKDSILYIQANELNEVYNEINMSENWKNTVEYTINEQNIQDLK